MDDVFDLEWGSGVSYREIRLREEVEQSRYVFAHMDLDHSSFCEAHRDLFDRHYEFSTHLLNSKLVLPSLEYCLTCSHLFNVLDACGGIGVTERTAYILRVRHLAVSIAKAYIAKADEDDASGCEASSESDTTKPGVK